MGRVKVKTHEIVLAHSCLPAIVMMGICKTATWTGSHVALHLLSYRPDNGRVCLQRKVLSHPDANSSAVLPRKAMACTRKVQGGEIMTTDAVSQLVKSVVTRAS